MELNPKKNNKNSNLIIIKLKILAGSESIVFLLFAKKDYKKHNLNIKMLLQIFHTMITT